MTPLLNLLVFAVALWFIDHVLADYHLADVARAFGAVHPYALALALFTTTLGYMALVAYDYIAFRFVGRPLNWRAMLVPSFVSFAVSNSAPASVLTAGGVRYRMYAGTGFTAAEAAGVAAFNVITYTLGLCAISGLVLLAHPIALGRTLPLLSFSSRALGVILLLGVAGYLVGARVGRRSFRLAGHVVPLPSLRVAARQLAVSAADWLLSSAALYVLLADIARISYLSFLTQFLVAQFAALLLPIPGGLGVFEAVVLMLTSAGAPAPRVLAALLLYRIVYYLLPLIVAGVLVVRRGLKQARQGRKPPMAWLKETSLNIAPHLLAFTAFASGWLLLLTGTIPSNEARLVWLARLLPISLIEASHFLASVVGSGLLVVAWGLEKRSRAAYRLAQGLFTLGIVLTLLRSFDLRLAILLAVSLAIVLLAGRAFPRDTSMPREPVSPPWIFAIGAALAVTIFVGTVAYRGTDYSRELWWRFTLNGNAPRALRGAVGMSVAVLLFGLTRLFGPGGKRIAPRREPRRGRTGDRSAPASRSEVPQHRQERGNR